MLINEEEENVEDEAQVLASRSFPYWKNTNLQEEGAARDIYPFDPKNQGQRVDIVNHCAQKCYNEDACMAFTFMENTKRCWLRTSWPVTIDENDERYTENMKAQKPTSGHRGSYVSNTVPLIKPSGRVVVGEKER